MTRLPESRIHVNRSGCHQWLGAVQSSGYGSVSDGNGGSALAHRVAWETANGPIPNGLTVDHLCRNKLCVNVDHMELVTRGENAARAHRAKTHCPRGHEYTAENTLTNTRGGRYCRECYNAARRTARKDPAA